MSSFDPYNDDSDSDSVSDGVLDLSEIFRVGTASVTSVGLSLHCSVSESGGGPENIQVQVNLN